MIVNVDSSPFCISLQYETNTGLGWLRVVDPILGPILFIMFSILFERASLEQSYFKVWADIMQRF